jgi:hypothetical protein
LRSHSAPARTGAATDHVRTELGYCRVGYMKVMAIIKEIVLNTVT